MPIKTVIDVGSNEGQFAKGIVKVFPDADLYCFEPLPGPFSKLREWADRQQSNVTASNLAIGDEEATLEMNLHTEHTPSSSLLETTTECDSLYPFTHDQTAVSVQAKTLDAAMDSFSSLLRSDILIKMDVQGYEDRVIRGGGQTFEKASAVILEVNLESLYSEQARFIDVLGMIEGHGLAYRGNLEQVYGSDGRVLFLDAVFAR